MSYSINIITLVETAAGLAGVLQFLDVSVCPEDVFVFMKFYDCVVYINM